MTKEEIVAEINDKGWLTIRWGHVEFSEKVIDAMMCGGNKPEYFILGSSLLGPILEFQKRSPTICLPPENSDEVCRIAGLSVFLSKTMPENMFACIVPDHRIFAGEDWEMTEHCASYIDVRP